MTRKFLWGVIVLLLLTNLVTIAVWMNERSQEEPEEDLSVEVNKKEPVATVNNETISYQEWTNNLENNYGEKALKQLIDKKLVFQLAKDEGIDISDKLIQREVSFLFTMQGVFNEEEIMQYEDTWSEEVEYRLVLEELLTQDIEIAEDELLNYHANYSNQYEFDESIQLSHIVVNDMDTAERVISELESGANFASLAREYTVDDDTRKDGGYLGYFTGSSQFIPSGYYEKSLSMDEHTYSEPFRVGENVAIIYLHRLLPAISFTYDEIKDHIKRELALDEINGSVSADSLWNQTDIEWIYE